MKCHPAFRRFLPVLLALLPARYGSAQESVPPSAAQIPPPSSSPSEAAIPAGPAGPASPSIDLKSLLQEGLFEEEAARNLDAAAQRYEALLAGWGEQRQFAASAIYRLAEVRRKQGRKEDAVKLYTRLLKEFSDIEPHAGMSRENLTALGVKSEPGPGTIVTPDEQAELDRLRSLVRHSPDQFKAEAQTRLADAALDGYLTCITYLIEKGVDVNQGMRIVPGDKLPASIRHAGNRARTWAAVPEGLAVNDLGELPVHSTFTTPLGAAALSGHKSACELLLAHGAKAQEPSITDPFSIAVLCGRVEIAKLLIDSGADPDLPIHLGSAGSVLYTLTTPALAMRCQPGTALMEALFSRRTDLAEMLLASGAGAKTVPAGGNPELSPALTPLHLAAGLGYAKLTAELLKMGADPNAPTQPHGQKDSEENFSFGGGYTPLHFAAAASYGDPAACAKLLIAAGADPNAQGGYAGGRPLPMSIETSTPEMIKLLISAGADVKAAQKSGLGSPLQTAVEAGRTEAVKLLLDAGADAKSSVMVPVNRQRIPADGMKMARPGTTMKSTLLHWKGQSLPDNAVEIASLLLAAGSDPNARDEAGNAPVHTAWSSQEMVALLAKAGADIKAVNSEGRNLLHLAAPPMTDTAGMEPGFLPWYRRYIEMGIDPLAADKTGATPIDLLHAPVLRVPLVRQFRYPAFFSASSVTLCFPEWNKSWELRARKNADSSPGPLHEILLRWPPPGQRNAVSPETTPVGWYPPEWAKAVIVRRASGKPDAEAQRIPCDLTKPDTGPEVQWGDVIEVTSAHAESMEWVFQQGTREGVRRRIVLDSKNPANAAVPAEMNGVWSLPQEIADACTARIVRHFTLKAGSDVFQLTARGDFKAPDLTRGIVCYGSLADIFGQTICYDPRYRDINTVHRSTVQGGEVINLSDPERRGSAFELMEGDVIEVSFHKELSDRAATGYSGVQLFSPGIPWSRWISFEVGPPGQKSAPDSKIIGPPTLLQAIAQIYAGSPPGAEKNHALLPHPDFSGLKIHRMGNDGILRPLADANLAAMLAAAESAPPEVLKAMDPSLAPGDIVEIPVFKGKFTDAWTGLDPLMLTLMKKALSVSIEVQIPEGVPGKLALTWYPPEIIQTPQGLISKAGEKVPDKLSSFSVPAVLETIPSPAGNWELFRNAVAIETNRNALRSVRGGVSAVFPMAYLRDGDLLRKVSNPAPVPGPRKRVVLPNPGQ